MYRVHRSCAQGHRYSYWSNAPEACPRCGMRNPKYVCRSVLIGITDTKQVLQCLGTMQLTHDGLLRCDKCARVAVPE